MSEIGNAVAFVFFGIVAVMIFAVLISVWKQGPTQIRNLRHKGYGLRTLANGQMPKPNNGSTIDVMEGLEFIADNGRVTAVRQTRTISAEIC
jgi:hypothetical protein